MDKYNKIERNLNNSYKFSTFCLLLVSLIVLPAVSFIFEYIFNFSINIFLHEYSYLIMITVLSPVIEEEGKIFVYNYFFKQRNNRDNLFIILIIGLLFGLTENILFYFGAASDFTSEEIIHRILNGEILHAIAPTFYISHNRSIRNNMHHFVLPVLIHATWNLLIYFELNAIFIYLFSLLLIIYLIIKIKRL